MSSRAPGPADLPTTDPSGHRIDWWNVNSGWGHWFQVSAASHRLDHQ
jgi:hypothetical protein